MLQDEEERVDKGVGWDETHGKGLIKPADQLELTEAVREEGSLRQTHGLCAGFAAFFDLTPFYNYTCFLLFLVIVLCQINLVCVTFAVIMISLGVKRGNHKDPDCQQPTCTPKYCTLQLQGKEVTSKLDFTSVSVDASITTTLSSSHIIGCSIRDTVLLVSLSVIYSQMMTVNYLFSPSCNHTTLTGSSAC